MKKFLTVVVLFAALMTAVPAKAEVKFGVKGGLNLTSMSLDAKAIDKVLMLQPSMISVRQRLMIPVSNSSLSRFPLISVMPLVWEALPASISSLVLSSDLMLVTRILRQT